MAMAVVSVAVGGQPVVETPFGMPVTESAGGRGVAVTKVVGKPGLPVIYVSEAGVPVNSGSSIKFSVLAAGTPPPASTLGCIVCAGMPF
jgi:hypothetical protein